jgi:hypothetical protein
MFGMIVFGYAFAAVAILASVLAAGLLNRRAASTAVAVRNPLEYKNIEVKR